MNSFMNRCTTDKELGKRLNDSSKDSFVKKFTRTPGKVLGEQFLECATGKKLDELLYMYW